MPSYSLVRPYPQKPDDPEEAPEFAVVADDKEAHYVFPQGSTFVGLDDARIQRLLSRVKTSPATELDWLKTCP